MYTFPSSNKLCASRNCANLCLQQVYKHKLMKCNTSWLPDLTQMTRKHHRICKFPSFLESCGSDTCAISLSSMCMNANISNGNTDVISCLLATLKRNSGNTGQASCYAGNSAFPDNLCITAHNKVTNFKMNATQMDHEIKNHIRTSHIRSTRITRSSP